MPPKPKPTTSSSEKNQQVPVSAAREGKTTTTNKMQSYGGMIYHEITSAENRDVVKAVGVFGLGVLFLSSSFSDYLLPPVM